MMFTADGIKWARCTVLVTVLALGLARPVAAQSPPDEHTSAMARDLFEQGVALGRRGEWAEARDRFQRVLVLRRTPVVVFNLATACVHLGRLVEATERFAEVQRDASAAADVRAASAEQVAALRPRLSRLTARRTGEVDGVRLELDGRELPAALLGVETPADPGHHVLVARRSGREVARSETDVAAGAAGELGIDVPVGPLTPPTPEETATSAGGSAATPAQQSGGGPSPWLWVGIGAAVAVVAAVIIIVVLATQSSPSIPPGDTSPGIVVW